MLIINRKNVLKTLLAGIFFIALSLSTSLEISASTDDIVSKCNYDAKPGVNPEFTTMNCLLTETALKYDIPPEIVKAIAEKESADWRHFDENGDAIVTSDNGIGLMQITDTNGYDIDRLKNDIAYNIQIGVQILDQKFKRSDLPTINSGDRDVIESWYFAIMAYNGTKPVNSPVIQATGETNTKAYQEEVFTILADYNLINLQDFPFASNDFEYDPDSDENITFLTKDYQFNLPLTKSKHHFEVGDKVKVTNDVNIRTLPTTDSPSKGVINKGEIVTVEGPFEYEQDETKKNHFVWYPVKQSDGIEGYVASGYLKYMFQDVPAGHWPEEEIYFLADRGILQGIGDNQFGLGQKLTRWQAVLLLTRANNVSLADRPDPGFTDVPKDYEYYSQIAAAFDEGLFQGTSETTFEPDATLKRSQMAVVLQRLYQFPDPASDHPFTDVKNGIWYDDAVARLYDAGITNGVTNTKFGPTETVSREQFAVFMTRSMDESYRIN